MSAVQNNIVIVNEAEARWTMAPVAVALGGVSTIQAGTPTKAVDAAGANPYLGTVVPMVDGDGTTSQRFTGLCKATSTDTAAAAGVTTLWLPLPGLVYASKSKDLTAVNTAAKLTTFFGKRVVFDLTASLWSIDTAAADAVANQVVIIGGDFNTSTVYFVYANSGTILNFRISA